MRTSLTLASLNLIFEKSITIFSLVITRKLLTNQKTFSSARFITYGSTDQLTISAVSHFLAEAIASKKQESLFQGRYSRFFQQNCRIPFAFWRSGRTSGFGDSKTPAGQDQIGKTEQREQLGRVLCQATVTSLPMTEQVLDDMKRMLNFRAHARF